MAWSSLHSTQDPHLGVVPAPPTPRVTHTPHLTLISASKPSWEGQPPTSPRRQGALGGPPSKPQFPPRGLARPQGLRGRAAAPSPLDRAGASSAPRNEGLGVASSRNPTPGSHRMRGSLPESPTPTGLRGQDPRGGSRNCGRSLQSRGRPLNAVLRLPFRQAVQGRGGGAGGGRQQRVGG